MFEIIPLNQIFRLSQKRIRVRSWIYVFYSFSTLLAHFSCRPNINYTYWRTARCHTLVSNKAFLASTRNQAAPSLHRGERRRYIILSAPTVWFAMSLHTVAFSLCGPGPMFHGGLRPTFLKEVALKLSCSIVSPSLHQMQTEDGVLTRSLIPFYKSFSMSAENCYKGTNSKFSIWNCYSESGEKRKIHLPIFYYFSRNIFKKFNERVFFCLPDIPCEKRMI